MHITCHVISPQLIVQCHKKKTMKRTPCGMRRGSATTDDQFAYFTTLDSNSVYSYQWNTEKWNELPPYPYRNSGLVIIDGELTNVGGYGGSRYTNKLLTLQQGRWVEHYPPMNTERSMTTVVSTSDGKHIIVIGGGGGAHGWTATVELFHVRSRRWYELTNLPQALTRPSATVCGSQLYVIGFYDAGYSCSLQDVLSSDQQIISQSILNILTWTLLPQLPVVHSTAATLCGQLVLVGGMRGGSQVNSIHQLIDGQWVEIGSMSNVRERCLVVSPSPDKMMIVGGIEGYRAGYTVSNSVEECVVV